MRRVKEQGLFYKLALFVGMVTQRMKNGYSDGKYVCQPDPREDGIGRLRRLITKLGE